MTKGVMLRWPGKLKTTNFYILGKHFGNSSIFPAPYTKHHLKIIVRQFVWQFYCDFVKFDKLSIYEPTKRVLKSYFWKPNYEAPP